MANPLQEAVADSIVREERDTLMRLPEAKRNAAIRSITRGLAKKTDDELISYISTNKRNISPEIRQRIEALTGMQKTEGGSILMGTKPLPGEIEHFKSQAEHVAELQQLGVKTGEPLPAGDISLGFAADPVEGVRSALSEHFGRKVPVFKRGEDLMYLNPQTKSVTRVEPSLLQSLGFGLPITGDILGTVGGGVAGARLTKKPAGVVAGETVGSGLGTGTGEYLRLYTGKVMGVHDLSNAEMLEQAGITGLKASAGTAVMGTLMASAKGLSNFFKGGIFTKDEALKHGMNSKEAEAVLEEVNKILGRKEIKGTLGKLTDDVVVQSKEAEVRRLGEHAQKFIDRDLADQKALTEALDVITKPSTAKQQVTEVLERQVGKRVSQAKEVVSENVTQLTKELSNIGKVSKELVGEPTRKVLIAKSNAAKNAQAKVWTDLKEKHGFVEKTKSFGIPIPRGKGATKLAAISKRRAETAQLIGVKSAEKKGLIQKAKLADLEDYNHNLSVLRADIRAASASRKAGDATVAGMKEIEQALIEDRRLALMKAGKGKLLKDIESAEKATADYYKTYRRSAIGDLTRKNDKGVFEIRSKEFVDKTLKGTDEEATQLLNVIGDHPTLVAQWKEGIADAYKRAAFKDNKFNREASTKFLRKNSDVLGKFFEADDLAKLEKTGSLAEKVAKQNDQLKRIIKNADTRFGRGKLKSLDPDNLVKFATNNTGSFAKPTGRGVQTAFSKIRYVKNITKNHPAAWESFKNEFSTQLRKEAVDIKTKGINPTSLNKIVNEKAPEIIEIMGKDYFNNLAKINKAVQVLGKKELKLVDDETKQGVLAVARALVAPPLTRRGRALTAGNIFLSKQGHRVIADSLLEPGLIKEVAKMAEHKKLTREAAELAVSLGFIGEE